MRALDLVKQWHERDARLTVTLNHWLASQQGLRPFFVLTSRAGDGWIWLLAFFLLMVRGQVLGMQHFALFAGLALAVYKLAKALLRRPRPCHRYAAVITLWVAPLDEFSFPSGHTLHAMGFTTLLLVHDPILGCAFLPAAIAIAISRIVLGLHYLSDVLVALVLGLALLQFVLAIWS